MKYTIAIMALIASAPAHADATTQAQVAGNAAAAASAAHTSSRSAEGLVTAADLDAAEQRRPRNG